MSEQDPHVPMWLRDALGTRGAQVTSLRRERRELILELVGIDSRRLSLVLHPPEIAKMPFSCSDFALGYRASANVTEAELANVCREVGTRIAADHTAAVRVRELFARHDAAADAELDRAIACVANGDMVGGLSAWRSAERRSREPSISSEAHVLFRALEGRVGGIALPPRLSPEEPLDEGWALAWAGDLRGAERAASILPKGRGATGLRGVIEGLKGRPREALLLLDQALEQGDDEELLRHRARVLISCGRLDEAERSILRIVDSETFGQRLLGALIVVRRGPLLPTFRRWCRRVSTSAYHFNGLFSTELPALVGSIALDRARVSRSALIGFLESLLDRMAGNLGRSPTFAEVAPDGRRSFVRLDLPPPVRTAAVEALHSLRFLGATRAEAELTSLAARKPPQVHARTHLGELYLWLGRYEEAWSEFVAARRIERVRWADIGMLAVLTLTGRTRRARMMAFYARHHFAATIPGATLPVYRGILRRKLGDLHGAIADLRAAIAVKPTRLGARMELCLALRAAGRGAEASEHEAILLRDAAPLLIDSADAIGVQWEGEPARLLETDVLEASLLAMRGNRASSLVTWIDGSGELRALTPTAELRSRAAQLASSG